MRFTRREVKMKKLIMMGAVAFAACAGAEEKAFWRSLFSSAEDTDVVAETAAKADSGIAKLTQQLKDLKAKMDETKKSSGDKWSELKTGYEKKYEDLKAKLKAKLEEYKAREAQKSEEERKKAEERKAKSEQTKKDGKNLIDSFKSLFD